MAYALIASTFVGDLLINLRSVYKQDKALSIGFWMMWIALFVFVPGRILYEYVARQTCIYWGSKGAICHLHDNEKLVNYLCYMTIMFLSLSHMFKILVWFFCKNLQLYEQVKIESKDEESGALQSLVSPETPAVQQEITNDAVNNSKYFLFSKSKLVCFV